MSGPIELITPGAAAALQSAKLDQLNATEKAARAAIEAGETRFSAAAADEEGMERLAAHYNGVVTGSTTVPAQAAPTKSALGRAWSAIRRNLFCCKISRRAFVAFAIVASAAAAYYFTPAATRNELIGKVKKIDISPITNRITNAFNSSYNYVVSFFAK